MALHQGSVTIPASGKVSLVAGITPAATRVPILEIHIENNAGNVMRIGDSNVSATRGISIAAGGIATSFLHMGPHKALNMDLSEIFVFGTQNDVLDFLYVK